MMPEGVIYVIISWTHGIARYRETISAPYPVIWGPACLIAKRLCAKSLSYHANLRWDTTRARGLSQPYFATAHESKEMDSIAPLHILKPLGQGSFTHSSPPPRDGYTQGWGVDGGRAWNLTHPNQRVTPFVRKLSSREC